MKLIDKYQVIADDITADISIREEPSEFVYVYDLDIPKIKESTRAYLDSIKNKLIAAIPMLPSDVLDPKSFPKLKQKFLKYASELIRTEISHLRTADQWVIANRLVQEMIGLGDMEFLLADNNIEEICIVSSDEPIWIYHKGYGWLKTNLMVPSESKITDYANLIGRRVGRSINVLNPLLDAHLITGDRVNATLYPVSMSGNTITIRKFARKPWTITDYIKGKSINTELAALLWFAVQYEMNVLVGGATATAKTTMLNILSSFIPLNQRIVSIEQTREIQLPKYYQWIPMLVRLPNPEGKGGIEMLDLMINSLRMRPDRLIVGEIRRAGEAEVMFEAMHSGHAVMATMHADTSEQVYNRLTNPPMNIPSVMLDSLNLILVMYRDRKSGIRRVFELAEILPQTKKEPPKLNILYRWDPRSDKIKRVNKSKQFMKKLKIFTHMSDSSVRKDLKSREKILKWMVKHNISDLSLIAEIVSRYNRDPDALLKLIKNKNFHLVLSK